MSEVLPLTTRTGALSVLRGVFLAAVLTAMWTAPGTAAQAPGPVLAVSGAYALVALVLEGARLATGKLGRTALGCGLLADGVYLVAVMTLAGGPGGLLGPLVLVHVVAVTLLASYRAGLQLAVWDALLLALAYSAQRADLIGGAAPSRQAAVTAAAAFLLVAAATAACSALNERELRRGRAGYGALAAVAANMQRVDRLEAVGPELLGAVERHTGYRRALVLLPGEADAAFACWTAGGRSVAAYGATGVSGVVRQCWDARDAVLARGLDPVADHPLVQALPGARNLVVLPLLAEGTALGALVVERAGGRRARVPASVVAVLAQFAAHAVLAYQKVALRDQLQRLAALDGLTELPNRRMFDETLARESQRAQRTTEPLALLMVDVDRFKAVNDRHGHHAGDDVLRQVARVIAGEVRGSDVPARYGGEEFAVLLPACDTAGAAGVAEKIRAAVAGVTVPVGVTVSIGVASLPQDAPSGPELVAAADGALYRAKAAGRDRVVRAAGPGQGATVTAERVAAGRVGALQPAPAAWPRSPADAPNVISPTPISTGAGPGGARMDATRPDAGTGPQGRAGEA